MKIRAVIVFTCFLLITSVAGVTAQEAPSLPATLEPPHPRVAVVLSGGSALGIAHVGALKVIERAGIPIDMILGTSMGSLVGGLYASGYSPDELEKIVSGIDWKTVFSEKRDSPGDRYDRLKRERFAFRIGLDGKGINIGPGLLQGQNVLSLFTALTLHDLCVKDFDALPVPYRAVAADILSGEKIVFSSGSIAEAMRSSMSIPGIFKPYEVEGKRLVDGGIVDNMPVDIAREMGADIIIAVESWPPGAKSSDELQSGTAITFQTLHLFILSNMRKSQDDADMLIQPDLTGFNSASFADAAALVKRGEEGAEKLAPALEKLARTISESRPLVKPAEQRNRSAYRDPPVLAELKVEGATPELQGAARAVFAPLVGHRLDRTAVQAAIGAVYATGHFDLVKFDLETPPGGADGEATGIVRLVPDATSESALFLSTRFRALFTTVADNTAELMPGIMLRDLTGKESAFFAEAGFQDRKRVYAEYFQPFGPAFLMPFAKYESQFDGYHITLNQILTTQFQTVGGGAWLGLALGKNADVMAGYSLASELSYDTYPEVNITVAALHAALRVDTRATSVFPESGVSLLLHGRWADPAIGGGPETAFTAADLGVNAALPLTRAITIGLAAFAGTDFAGILPVNGMLTDGRYYTPRHPGMFYSLESLPDRLTGDTVGALGLEVRVKVGQLSSLIGGDIYVLGNFSAAVAQRLAQMEGDPTVFDFLPVRWNAAAGVGLRISNQAGVLITAGVINDGNPILGAQRFALTIEAGSFSEFLEDVR